MKQAAAALLGAGFTLAACYAAGVLLIERLRLGALLRRTERIPLAILLGAAAVHLLMFVLLAAQVLYWPVPIALLLGVMVWAYRSGAWAAQGYELGHVSLWLKLFATVLAGFFLSLYFPHAWAPEHSPDGAAYHLGFVSRFLAVHGFERVTTNIYGMLSQGVELLYLPAFIIGRHSAAALTHLLLLMTLAFAIFEFGRRLNKPWVGAASALLTFLSPVVGLTASIAYTDAATAAAVFAAFYWLELWDREHGVHADAWRLLIPAGLMAGFAFATKYTAFPIAIYAAGFVAFRARRVRPLLLLAGMIAVMAGPWIARNWILYGNPTAPLLNAVFRNPYVHVDFEAGYTEYLRHYEVTDLRTLPLEVAYRGMRTQGIIGPVFLLLPLGLFAFRRRVGRHLWIAALLLLAVYPLNVGTRFLIPPLPFFSLAIALALGETPLLLSLLLLIHGYLSWPTHIPKYAGEHAWQLQPVSQKVAWSAALRITDPDAYLNSRSPSYSAARLIERHVPAGQAIFALAGLADAYTRRQIRVGYQSASNELLADIFHTGHIVGLQPIRAHIFRFPARTARRFRVVQTAEAAQGEIWNIHELRFFRNGAEIPRAPAWRLQAWPMPWDVQLAFDNSPGTRWRSWETARPGMYVEADFGREEAVDEIRIETSADSVTVRLSAEVSTGTDAWEKLPVTLESVDTKVTPNARRVATQEIHRRGVDYFLFFEDDFGADDVREDPESWGLAEIGRAGRARLYKSVW